ncbi:hypothetical protein FF38_06528 [Lucilia cuprina]|uniref:Uncharacterized protein n=1 Tax=Lucilia cuprina TaxID=7375 RepID=A0A0L0C5E8_LUCCU|nr:hypothetical protein FF38_06528 [Lucilia cuprina]
MDNRPHDSSRQQKNELHAKVLAITECIYRVRMVPVRTICSHFKGFNEYTREVTVVGKDNLAAALDKTYLGPDRSHCVTMILTLYQLSLLKRAELFQLFGFADEVINPCRMGKYCTSYNKKHSAVRNSHDLLIPDGINNKDLLLKRGHESQNRYHFESDTSYLALVIQKPNEVI